MSPSGTRARKKRARKVPSLNELRRRVENSDGARPVNGALRRAGAAALVHEVAVQQEELTLQHDELRRASVELERSRDRYFELYDLAPVGYLNVDLSDKIVEANHAASTLLGLRRGSLLRRRFSSHMSRSDMQALRLVQDETLASRATAGCELTLFKWKGGRVKVHAECRALIDADGLPEGFLYALLDLTDLRRTEEELRHAQKMETIGTLAGAIAHDFGNLLQGIMGCALLAGSDQVAPGQRAEYLDRIGDAVRRGSDLVGRLMSFGRKQEAEPRPIRFDEVVTGTAVLIGRLVGANVRLEVQTRAPGAIVRADPVQIEQILINLAANARDAMPEGGTLLIETTETPSSPHAGARAGRAVRVLVRDTGTGIDERIRARIFEPFFTTKPLGLGTGLGLATVLAITRGLGGRVDVESEVGKGSSFILHLPCTDEAPAVIPARGAERRLRGRVLLVEDDGLARMTICHFLQELGIDVLEAPDVARAIEIAETRLGSIDLCISDVTLPDGTGPRLTTLLQQRSPGLRSLFISAHPAVDLVDRGLLDKALPTLRKPFGKRELADAVAALLPAAVPADASR